MLDRPSMVAEGVHEIALVCRQAPCYLPRLRTLLATQSGDAVARGAGNRQEKRLRRISKGGRTWTDEADGG